jgi:NAD(P)-dependent dehydrogenase (short-subunit alcohol dehydrogenase family)
METALDGAHVVVVGGSSGMGLAVATLAHQHGAQVTIASRGQDRLEAAAAQIGSGAKTEVLDTTSEEAVTSCFEKLGLIDHLVIPGSSVRTGALKELPLSDALFTMRSKFWGPYLCAKHAQIDASGSITLFSGILSRRPGNSDAVLAPVNAAVEALGRALAMELAPVRVNVISPGMTAGTGAYLAIPEAAREAMFAAIAKRLPVGRVGAPDDVAEAALMLMTNGFITGVVLDVDGGGLLV